MGVVRFQRDADGLATASISVAAAARAHGFGHALLAAGVAAAWTELRPTAMRAWIRAGNAASKRLFQGVGFRPMMSPELDGVVEYRLTGDHSPARAP